MSTKIKTTTLSNTEEVQAMLDSNKLRLSNNGIALVINLIEESDKDKFKETIRTGNELYAIEEAVEGDSVDSITLKGEYILNY